MGTPSVDVDSFLSKLESIDFFDGFPDTSKREYIQLIRSNLEEQLQGPNAEYFRAYPGLSLVVTDVELIIESVEVDIESLADNSFGLFDPTEIQVVGDINHPTLEFDLEGNKESFSDDASTFILRCFDFAASRFGRVANLVRPHGMVHPSNQPLMYVLLCRPQAFKRLEASAMIPVSHDEIEAHSFMDWVD